MVVGGASDEKLEDKGYVISLDDNVPVPTCLQSVCDYPNYFYAATAGTFEDGLPTVCGGRNHNTQYTLYDSCYKFNYTNAWEPAGTLSYKASHDGEFEVFYLQPLSFTIYFIFQGYSYQDGWGLVRTGGHTQLEESNDVDTIDFSSDGETWGKIPTRIPEGLNFTN